MSLVLQYVSISIDTYDYQLALIDFLSYCELYSRQCYALYIRLFSYSNYLL